ncbi:MAG TPA: cobalamin biosynthesis protein CbiX, partial [Opitutaceae bacterium]
MTTLDRPLCFLFDNGSLRAASTLSLRGVAAALSTRIDAPVRAVSLLHSSAIDPAELDGEPAELLEPALDAYFASGGRSAVLLPLFFGPSAALTDYVPARVE